MADLAEDSTSDQFDAQKIMEEVSKKFFSKIVVHFGSE